MASKDQAIGAIILIICAIVAIGYAILVVYPDAVLWVWPGVDPLGIRSWAVAIVVLIAFLAVMFIGAWIGWTMMTTPPPKPIEELELEEEEKKEEEKPSEEMGKIEEKTETEAKAEEKPKRGRRKEK